MALDKNLVAKLRKYAKSGDSSILRSAELKSLSDQLKTLPAGQRKSYGQELNKLKAELQDILAKSQSASRRIRSLDSIDITAPFDINAACPVVLAADKGSKHPLSTELETILDIYARMGFSALESRQLDDDYNMFSALNFPAGHPARDDYDTFITEETDKSGVPLVSPAHTSTMQNRVLRDNLDKLKAGEPIAYVIPGRVFRNEDVDARHDHTFHQLEAVFVDKGVHVGMLIATLKTFFQEYYARDDIELKTQPFYFPFTEPSFEFAASCIFCGKAGCNICSYSGWIELGGCGMIHPNVLREARIDPKTYTGFAWGFGIERMVMLKYDIEDIRHFHGGKINFLRQFS